MYVATDYGGFDMKIGRKINELGPHLLQYQDNAFFSKPGNLQVYSRQPKPADPYIKTWLNMNCSHNTSDNKDLFEVKNHPQHLCNKPTLTTQCTLQLDMEDSI